MRVFLRSCGRPKAYNLRPLKHPVRYVPDFTSAHRFFASSAQYPTRLASHLTQSSIMRGMDFNANTTLEEDTKNWKSVPAKGNMPVYHVYDAPIQKSPADDREYRVVRLENGLEAVLIHDAKTDKAAASLDVAVGHLSDPVSNHSIKSTMLHEGFLGRANFAALISEISLRIKGTRSTAYS